MQDFALRGNNTCQYEVRYINDTIGENEQMKTAIFNAFLSLSFISALILSGSTDSRVFQGWRRPLIGERLLQLL